MRPNVMPRRSRRRRRTPPAAEVWRILRLTIREDRIARRRLAALEEQYREEERERKRRTAALEEEFRKAAEEREIAAKQREEAEARRKQAQAAMERKLNKIAGDADNRWGRLMEALVEGNLVPLFQGAGVPVVEFFGRLRSQIGGIWREYDLAAVGESDVMVVEVKTTLRPSDVQRFTERIADFRRWRPFEARERVWGALAYLSAEGEALRAAEAAGFYLVRAVGGSARLANSKAFQPRSF